MHYPQGQTASKEKEDGGRKNRAHQAKKSSVNLTMVGLSSNRGVYPTSSKFSEAKKFVWRLNKVQGKYIQEQQPN